MKRREFISLLGGTAIWPLAAGAQQAAMPTVGFLDSATGDAYAQRVAAVRKGLSEAGFIEGRNVAIEGRSAGSGYDQLPALAADLVRRKVSVIITTGVLPTRAAMAASATIPIVFETGDDPVAAGLVASFNRPGGNVTGISLLSPEMATKRLEFLRELVPKAQVVGILINSTNPTNERQLSELQAAARTLMVQLHVVRASDESSIDAAFAIFVQQRVGALIVGSDPLFFSRRDQLVALAERHAMPTSYPDRELVAAGGLISYAANRTDGLRQTGIYASRILMGVKAADLPVLLPIKFELVINMKTAKALGLTVPLTLQVAADEIIE